MVIDRPGEAAAAPAVALFCATFLKPEMLHIHRHVAGLKSFRPIVITEKCEGDWPVVSLVTVDRSPGRFLSRAGEKIAGHPWQISSGEAARILATMSETQSRLLHIFFGNVAIHLLPLLRRCPVPVVVSFHGSDVAGTMTSPGYAAAVAELFHLAAVVPCRSDQLAGRVAALGCPEKKLRIMRTILPEIIFTQRTPPEDRAWKIVQAARLVPKKGLPTALRAFASFAKEYPRSTFTIAGSGPMEEELRQLAGELKIEGRVAFMGFLSQPDLQQLFADSHIFLQPSETVDGDVEGVPNAMLEAMAGGLPVVATRHGGIPEVIIDGVNGLLTDEKNPGQLANALFRLAGDADLFRTLSAGAASSVRAQFSGGARIAATEAIYREAIFSQCGGQSDI